MFIFGICVIASGLWRFIPQEGGETGLWFGLVMGGLALLSAFLYHIRKTTAAMLTGWISLLTVCGWFVYESLVRKGLSEAEPRQLIIIGIALVAVLMILYITWNNTRQSGQDSDV